MNGSIEDLVSLAVPILFFGVYQRHREQKYFRLWCVAWALVFLSVLVWAVRVPETLTIYQEVVRYELLVAGEIVFLMSLLLTKPRRLREMRAWGSALFVASGLVIAVGLVSSPGFAVLSVLVVAGQAVALVAIMSLVPKVWMRRRWMLAAIVVLSGIAMLLWHGDEGLDLINLVLAEILACTAVVYAEVFGLRKTSGWMGTLGFTLWGIFYLFVPRLSHMPLMAHVFDQLWNVPKKLVGFAMILHVFDTSRYEAEEIANEYKLLYDDFRLLYEGHPYPMWIYESESEAIVSVNRVAVESYGYSESEFLKLRMTDLEKASDGEAEALASLLPEPSDGQRTRHRYKDGQIVWVNVAESAIVFQRRDARLVMARDVTDRLRVNLELAHKAHHDPLTGLPNRLLLSDRMQQSLARSEREHTQAVLFMIDIDHFKQINDTYGHLIGDECLRQVAARLAQKIRQIDTIARVGGEEFAAVIGGLSSRHDAQKIANMLLAQFEKPIRVGRKELKLTVSIGAAMFPDDGTVPDMLLEEADRALYAAKAHGRNRAMFTGHQEDSDVA